MKTGRSVAVAAAAFAALLCGTGASTGCKSRSQAPSQGSAAGAQSAQASRTAGEVTGLLTPEQAAQVLARVGDRTITLGDYAAALEHMDQFDRLRFMSAERRKELLDEMISVELLAQEAVAKGYDKDPLAQQEARAILRDAMLAEARKNAPTPADVPEQEVRAWFDAHRAEYKDPERRRISVIVVRDESAARRVLAAVKAAPLSAERWGELVREYSVDAQARADVPLGFAGDFGIVSPPGDARGETGRVPEAVRAAVFALAQVGDVLEQPVEADGRLFIARLTQTLPARERTYEEAERSIRVLLAQEKVRGRETELLAELRKSMKVEIDEAALASVAVRAPAPPGPTGSPPSPRPAVIGADAGAASRTTPHSH